MRATFSDHTIRAMGFNERVAAGALMASFVSVTVYEARGIVVPEKFTEAKRGQLEKEEYRVALAQSVNAGCQAILGDDFVESEVDWRKAMNSDGPFVLIAVGPTKFLQSTAGHAQRHSDGSLTTFDSFPQVRDVLASLELRVLPPLVASISCTLSAPDRYVELRRLERTSSGRCPDGTHVRDMRIDVNAEGYVSRRLDERSLICHLSQGIALASRINKRAASFFALAAAERDQLKRFLYFFLALEVQTHAAFGKIDHRAIATRLVPPESSTAVPTVALISNQISSLRNLFDRFVWCAACLWSDVAEADVLLFKELKLARDSIAHGSRSEAPTGYAKLAEDLAKKILCR